MDNFKFFRIFLLCIGGALAAPQMAMAQASAYEKIEIEKWPKLEYKHGDNFDISGISVRISYSDNSATSDDDCEDGENFESGKCYKIVEYDDFATDIDVEVTIGTGTAVSNNFGDIELKLEDNNKDINIKVTYGENNDAISNGTDGNGETNTLTVSPIQVNPIQIAISTPVTGETPSGSASVTQSNSSNAVDGIKGTGTEFDITWKANGTDFTGKFKGNTEYTAVVELEADDDYVFAALTTVPGLEECTNSSSSDPALLSVDNAGKKLTITCVFPETDPASVTEIKVQGQPTTTTYVVGNNINLSGLTVNLEFNDETSASSVAPANFATYGITTDPNSSTSLTKTYDGKKIGVFLQSNNAVVDSTTGTLTVNTPITSVNVAIGWDVWSSSASSSGSGSALPSATSTTVDPTGGASASSVTWTYGGSSVSSTGGYGTYTASATFTANTGYVFTNSTLATVTNGTSTTSASSVSSSSNTLTITQNFTLLDPTAAVNGIEASSASCTHGDTIEECLTGKDIATLKYSDNTTKDVKYEALSSNGIGISFSSGLSADSKLIASTHTSATFTVTYSSFSASSGIGVAKADISGATVAMSKNGWFEGETAGSPSVSGAPSDYDEGNITYEYKADGASSFGATMPSSVGEHQVQAKLAADGNYNEFTTEPISFTIDEVPEVLEIVSEVKITMEAPATGEPFIIAAADVTVVESEDEFTVTSVTWTPATSGNKFAPETEYTVEIKLTAEPGYTFDGYPAPNQNPRINGQGADTANNTGATIEITYKFPKTEPAAPGPKITNFSVVNQPRKLDYVTGEKLSLNGLKLSLQWDKAPEPGKTLPETLEYGDADFGEYFTTDPEHGVNLSMSDDGMPIAINAINSAAAPRYTEPMHVSEQTIGNISVKIDRPITDEKPSKEAEIAAGAGFDVYSVVWNPNHEMFQSKRQYAVIITLAAKTGYAFNKENPSVLINGAEPTLITVGNKGATLTLSYTFEPTKEIVVVKVGGEILDNNNRQFYYVPKCGESNPEITVSAGTDEVTIHGEGSFETGLDDLLFGENIFTMSTGDGKDYELIISKPMPTENMVRMRWDNTFTIIDNEYYDPKNTYKWYRNGREAGSGRSWSIGVNGEKINKADSYYVEATAESGKKLRSCEIEAPPPPAAKPQYGIMLKDGLEVLAPEKSETDIFIYNAAGKLAAKLNGNHINAKNINIPNGLYFVRARAIGESGAVYRYSAKLVVRNK